MTLEKELQKFKEDLLEFGESGNIGDFVATLIDVEREYIGPHLDDILIIDENHISTEELAARTGVSVEEVDKNVTTALSRLIDILYAKN